MTLIMLWREAGAERIWLLSDSRFSPPSIVGRSVPFTDHAAKILEALVTLNGTSRRLGFAYAGSSLVALQAYSAVLPLWTRLESIHGETRFPTIGECAQHLSKFVTAYARDVGTSGNDGRCQCILVGYDNGPHAWIVDAENVTRDQSAAVSSLPLIGGEMYLFGSGKAAAETLLRPKPSDGWRKEPLEIMRRHLRADQQADVGGGVQIGVTWTNGFDLYFDAQPLVAGVLLSLNNTLKYRGFNFQEVSVVGPAFATLRGISG